MANFYGDDTDEFPFVDATNYYGGDGNDILEGGDGSANQIYGGQGNDFLSGSRAQTQIGDGTADNPFFVTGFVTPSGDDYLEGGAGRDMIFGVDGNDTIFGGDGDDSGSVQGTTVNSS
jgi:Ca2+-binding RTX toxin-like protein